MVETRLENQSLRVSIVVPTFNRPDLIKRCLQALCAQNFSRNEFEILVADDAYRAQSDDRSLQILIESFASCGVRVTYVPVEGRHGPSAARNRGWRRARAPIIAFTDDDTIPDRDWLLNGVKALEREERLLAVSGQTIVPLPKTPTDYEKNESGLSRGEFISANCFVLREALVEIGGFDERFTTAWREDSDLHFRLLNLGGPDAVRRVNRAVVIHPIRPAKFGIGLKQARKVHFNALLFKKHPHLYRTRIQRLPPLRYYLMMVLLITAGSFALVGNLGATLIALGAWSLLVAEFTLKRLKATTKRPAHVIEMLVTSVLLAPVVIFWRLYGAYKFRVAFV